MEGPRALRRDEVDSLAELVDAVFRAGESGSMFRWYPQYFGEENIENHFVFVDGGRVVSHFGMMPHWASIAGCRVRVACVGAVGTYEAYRGRGLATRLMDATCEKAIADRVDFLLISGGRGLYLRAGGAVVGCDCTGAVSRESADRLRSDGLLVDELTEQDLPACKAAHEARPAHFVRDLEEWAGLHRARTAQCRDVRFFAVREKGRFRGYLVVSDTDHEGVGRLVEFAGESNAIAGALGPLMERSRWRGLELRLQTGDRELESRLEEAGVEPRPTAHTGTLLLLRFTSLMQRLRPHFRAQLGAERAGRLCFKQRGDLFVLADDLETVTLDRAQAAQAVFGRPEGQAPFSPDGALAAVLPIPTLCYGMSYV